MQILVDCGLSELNSVLESFSPKMSLLPTRMLCARVQEHHGKCEH